MVVILSVGQSKVNVVVNTISDGIENHLEERNVHQHNQFSKMNFTFDAPVIY